MPLATRAPGSHRRVQILNSTTTYLRCLGGSTMPARLRPAGLAKQHDDEEPAEHHVIVPLVRCAGLEDFCEEVGTQCQARFVPQGREGSGESVVGSGNPPLPTAPESQFAMFMSHSSELNSDESRP